MFTGKADKWTQVGGPSSAIYGGGFHLLATNPDTGDLYKYDGTPMKWHKIGGPGKYFVVTNSSLIFGRSPDANGIWQYSDLNWKQIGDPARDIYSSTVATGLYATNPDTVDIYSYDLLSHKWARIGGSSKIFCCR